MTVRTALFAAFFIGAAACGGGAPTATRTPAPAASLARPTSAAGTTGATADAATALCFLTATDFQAFNYVTSANPDVTSDEGVAARCQYASGLFLEVYTEDSDADAEETYQTVLADAPFDAGTQVTLPGADEAEFDPEVSDNHAGIAVRSGKLVFTISGLARETAQAELTTLAGLVLTRSAALQ